MTCSTTANTWIKPMVIFLLTWLKQSIKQDRIRLRNSKKSIKPIKKFKRKTFSLNFMYWNNSKECVRYFLFISKINQSQKKSEDVSWLLLTVLFKNLLQCMMPNLNLNCLSMSNLESSINGSTIILLNSTHNSWNTMSNMSPVTCKSYLWKICWLI